MHEIGTNIINDFQMEMIKCMFVNDVRLKKEKELL